MLHARPLISLVFARHPFKSLFSFHQRNDFVTDFLRKKNYKMWKWCVRGFVGHRIAMFERQHARSVHHSRSKVFVERQRSFVSSTCSSLSITSNDANVAWLCRRCAATMRRLACARQQVSRALLNPTPAALFTLVKYAVDNFFPLPALFEIVFAASATQGAGQAPKCSPSNPQGPCPVGQQCQPAAGGGYLYVLCDFRVCVSFFNWYALRCLLQVFGADTSTSNAFRSNVQYHSWIVSHGMLTKLCQELQLSIGHDVCVAWQHTRLFFLKKN